MAKSKSSRRWLKEHFSDEFVQRAQREGFRGRAVYKLEEIDRRERLLRAGMTVLDLGAAPGGWSQYAIRAVQPGGRVMAFDLLPIEPIEGVEIQQGDFTEDNDYQTLLACLPEGGVDLVMSDMAPNISGINAVDQPRAMYLAELVLELTRTTLCPHGDLLIKLFQGEGFDAFVKLMRQRFRTVKFRKPKASRARSREVYALARDYVM